MAHIVKRILSVVVIGLLGLVAPVFAAHTATHAVAQAPAFALPNEYGKKISLQEFKGKIVVLEWTNHECPFVKKHYSAGNMQALQRKYTKQGIIWLSIVSSAPGNQGHISGKQAQDLKRTRAAASTFTLIDETGEVGRQYKAKTTPHIFIIDTKGNLVYQGAIDSIPSTDSKDILRAKNYVDETLTALLANNPVSTYETKPYGCSVKY